MREHMREHLEGKSTEYLWGFGELVNYLRREYGLTTTTIEAPFVVRQSQDYLDGQVDAWQLWEQGKLQIGQ